MRYINVITIFLTCNAYAVMHRVATEIPNSKIYYYQEDIKVFSNFKGDLVIRKNKEVTRLIKGDSYHHYAVTGVNDNYILIQADATFYSNPTPTKDKTIVLIDIQSLKTTVIDTGHGSYLFQDMIAFYKLQNSSINLYSISQKKIIHQLTTISKYYVSPPPIIYSRPFFLYSDRNKKHILGILAFNTLSNSIVPIVKFNSSVEKINFCNTGEFLFIYKLSNSKASPRSSIDQYKIDFPKITFQKNILTQRIRQKEALLMYCKDKYLYFSTAGKKKSQSLYRYHIQNEKLKMILDSEDIASINEVNNTIAILSETDYYYVDSATQPSSGQIQ